MKRYALALLLVLLPCNAFAQLATPAEAPVYPEAIVCVESAGTSLDRPCQPWCDKRLASHVLRFMRVLDPTTGAIRYEWQHIHCLDYLDERKET